MEVHDIVQETGIKTIPTEKKCKKAKWLSEEALQIAVKRREVESNGEGGTPLQYSCLENPRDGEIWWAAIYGVPQSRTRLKRRSSSSSSSSIYLRLCRSYVSLTTTQLHP